MVAPCRAQTGHPAWRSGARQRPISYPLVAAFGQRMLFTDRIGRTRQNDGELLVAWSGGRPVGNVYLWYETLEEPELRAAFPATPLLNHLEVAPRHQGRGIGTMLIRACEDAARGRAYTRLLVAVAVDNTAAKKSTPSSAGTSGRLARSCRDGPNRTAPAESGAPRSPSTSWSERCEPDVNKRGGLAGG